MNIVLEAVAAPRSGQRRGIRMCVLVGLALAMLSACTGSSEATLEPVTVEPQAAQPDDQDADQPETDTSDTEQSIDSEQQRDEVGVFESLNFLAYVADSMGVEIHNLLPREAYEIGGTGCQAKSFETDAQLMDGGGTHFAVTPEGERIAGAVEGAIQAVWSACYDSRGIEITSDQLVQLVVNFGEVRFPQAEDDATLLALDRRGVPYEPPSYERDGDDFTFSVLVYAREFGDVYRVHLERAGDDFTVEYEELLRG